MNIMVTGGAGFIGGNLCAKLLDKGYKVFIIDDLSTGSKKNIPPNTEFYKLDLSNQEAYKKLPKLPKTSKKAMELSRQAHEAI